MSPKRACKADECPDPVHGQGYCVKHYKRWRKTGSTDLPEKPGCLVDDCAETAAPGRRGWCGKHYSRWYKHGDPLVTAVIVGDDEARFWSKVRKDGPVPEHSPELGPCWPWDGNTDEAGYGVFNVVEEGRPRNVKAHRWLLGHLRGKPLSREVVGEEDGCHHCDNPPCCNPDHLYIGTRKQNVGDAVERSRLWQLKKDTCPHGHPLDGVKAQKGKTRRYCKTCEKEASHARRTTSRKACKNGHALEGDNILLCKDGKRKCRICEDARIAKIREQKAARDECRNGHPYTEENTQTMPNGTRRCLACRTASEARRWGKAS